MIIGNKQRFKTFDKTTLKISTPRCFDCSVNQPAMIIQKLYITTKANVNVTMNGSKEKIYLIMMVRLQLSVVCNSLLLHVTTKQGILQTHAGEGDNRWMYIKFQIVPTDFTSTYYQVYLSTSPNPNSLGPSRRLLSMEQVQKIDPRMRTRTSV
jgi:hypothetical protein